jgi:outer membrane protein assembly factor BamD
MFRRFSIALLLATSLLTWVACKNQKAANPLAHVNSKQPDKVLYDRAMEAMKEHKYDTARLTLQTLINAYPDSEYIARAKLTVGESWYQEGTPAGLSQAETEFRDFITFFPNMPEAAEAQLKIADIHYKQMGKPDRDYTHAMRAQEEYRQLLMQYPDSKQVDLARLRLLEVQEVLAEREYRIARFYYLRGSLLASIARAKTLTDTYPLYSQADDALYMMGQAYEQQADRTRITNLPDGVKQHLIKDYLDSAAQAYSKILTRYPAMPRFKDARSRLTAMKRPVPTPTPEAIALNKKELASRTATSHYERFVTDMGKRPDLSEATRVGSPSMTDPKETDAPELAHEIDTIVKSGMDAKNGTGKVAVEAVSASAAVTENQPAPHSAVAAANASDVPAEAPSQLNESAPSSSDDAASSSSSAPNTKDDSKNASSSQKAKKKHHFHIPIPL